MSNYYEIIILLDRFNRIKFKHFVMQRISRRFEGDAWAVGLKLVPLLQLVQSHKILEVRGTSSRGQSWCFCWDSHGKARWVLSFYDRKRIVSIPVQSSPQVWGNHVLCWKMLVCLHLQELNASIWQSPDKLWYRIEEKPKDWRNYH